MAGKVVIHIDPNNFNPQEVLDRLTVAIRQNFDTVVGPHFVKVARKRAPVSKARKFNPRNSSFGTLKLAPLGSLGSREDNVRLAELSGYTAAKRAKFFREAFGTDTQDPRATQFFRTAAGERPDALRVRRGTIQGATQTQRPGRLRDSIRYVGSRREGNLVIGVAEATAPYAAAIHDGEWTSTKGKPVRITPRPFFTNALPNVKDDVHNASKYKVK